MIVGVGLVAGFGFGQHLVHVGFAEHRQLPHIPVGVHQVLRLDVLDGRVPAFFHEVLDLFLDLLGLHGGQVGEGLELAAGGVAQAAFVIHHFRHLISFQVDPFARRAGPKPRARCANFSQQRFLLVGHVELVHGVEFELDLFPCFHGDLQFGAVRGGGGENFLAFLLHGAAFVARFDAGFQRDAVGRGASRIAPGVAKRAATELQHGVVTEDGHQRGHVPDVNAAGSDRDHAGHRTPVLIEEQAARTVFLDELVTHGVDPAQRRFAVAFELADDGARVQVVATRQTQHLGQHAEVNAVVRVAVEHGVHGAVDVQQHAVIATPVGQAGVGREAAGQVVVHDDGCADFLGELGTLVHLFGRGGGHVQVVALALAGLTFRLEGGFVHEGETVTPTHEGLAVDVLVVFGEVETAAQALVHGAAVVLGRQAQLGFDGAAQQRTTVLIHLVALNLDAVGRAAAGLDVGDGEAHVFQAQGAQGLEAEHVADQRGQHVDHRAFLEQIDRVGHEGVEAGVVAGHVFDAIGAALVVVEVGQQIGPHRGPGAGRRLGGHGGGNFFTIHARLRGDLEAGQNVRVFRLVVGGPVSLPVFLHTGVVGFHCHCLLLHLRFD